MPNQQQPLPEDTPLSVDEAARGAAAVAALPDALRASVDPEALQELLHRCVRGERNAARCLESTLEWRREHGVDEVSSD